MEKKILRNQILGADPRRFWDSISAEQQRDWSTRLRHWANICLCGCRGDAAAHDEERYEAARMEAIRRHDEESRRLREEDRMREAKEWDEYCSRQIARREDRP